MALYYIPNNKNNKVEWEKYGDSGYHNLIRKQAI